MEQSVLALVHRQIEAWNQGDAEAHGADVTEDVWFTNLLGQSFHGRREFVDRHAFIFSTIFMASRLSLGEYQIQQLSANIAMVESSLVLSGFQHLPPGTRPGADGNLHTRLLQVLVKREGAWRVAAYHNVDVKPLSGESRAC